jgi:hypothetical protein
MPTSHIGSPTYSSRRVVATFFCRIGRSVRRRRDRSLVNESGPRHRARRTISRRPTARPPGPGLRLPQGIPCANRRVTTPATAGSDAANNASADNDLRWLAHVTTRSDGLLWTILFLIAQCDPCHRPLPAGSLNDRDPVATGRAPGETAQLDGSAPTGSPPSMPIPRAAVASSKANGTRREWCPVFRVASARSGVRDGQKH